LRREASLKQPELISGLFVHGPAVDMGNSMAFFFNRSPVLVAMLVVAGLPQSALAQSQSATLDDVTVAGKASPVLDVDSAEVSGFAVPLARLPQSVTVITSDLMTSSASQTLSDVIRLDASMADNYNTTGYIESMSLRGFLLNQSGNYVRNGLANSNYAPAAFENKERIEVLKGVAGLQAGVSAPGGLVNYVTKQPEKAAFTNVTLAADGSGGTKAQLDTNQRINNLGVRLNLVDEVLHPQFDSANGSRQLLSLALAGELMPMTKLSADVEWHHKRQPSVPGLGLLDSNGDGVGDTLPTFINPRLNLNNQIWSQAFEAAESTAEVAIDHRLNAEWAARVAINMQDIRINDRIAFPDGCSSAVTYVYPGLCGNGDVDIYDYRSDGERRHVTSWIARLDGSFSAFGMNHVARVGLDGRNAGSDLAPMQAYNWVGTTNIYAQLALPADGAMTNLNTNSHERELAGYATLVSDIRPGIQSFLGAKVTRISRSSERSDGSQAVSFEQTVTTPWAGLAWSARQDALIYASWGQGVEMEVVPNRPTDYANYGQLLPALTSEQSEFGLKWQANSRLLFSAAAFVVDKPYADDVAAADVAGLPTRLAGVKAARHRGVELTATGRLDAALTVQASVMGLDARFTRAANAAVVGQRVTNVPRLKASVFGDYRFPTVSGLSLNALVTLESGKSVTGDENVVLPFAWQLDTGMAYKQKFSGKTALWRFNVQNLTNRVFWREAATTEWGGIYLFPAAPRTLRASVTYEF
jgi:iron complex outermembrane receptor protein